MDEARTGLPVGADAGMVSVTEATEDEFTVVATSRSDTTFTVAQPTASGQLDYTCSAQGEGACPSDGDWSK
jgi:hypothetical protein